MGGGQTEFDGSPADTAQREAGEECIVSRDGSRGTRILPPLGYVSSVIPLANHLFASRSLSFEGVADSSLILLNEPEARVECVLQWTLPEIPTGRLTVLHNENHPSGGKIGGAVFAFDPTTGKIAGVFNGAQGFFPLESAQPVPLHGSVKQLLWTETLGSSGM